MKHLTEQMQTMAYELLVSGEVDTVIGWEKGSRWFLTPPVLIRKAADVYRLHFDSFAIHNLSGYLPELQEKKKRCALFVKGCDSRSVIRLVQDHQIDKEQMIVIGLPCPGMQDSSRVHDTQTPHALPFLAKCQECAHPTPVYSDREIESPNRNTGTNIGNNLRNTAARVLALEQLQPDEKYDFWQKQLKECIRCNACRSICPACSCRVCIFDSEKRRWATKEANLANNAFFIMTRALHVAGRCTECGECERVCPVGLPIMTLNQFIAKEIAHLDDSYSAGTVESHHSPLNTSSPVRVNDCYTGQRR